MHQGADQTLKNLVVEELFEPQGVVLHRRRRQEFLTAATKTVDVQDNAKVFLCTVTTVITLPSVGATYGPFIFMNYAADGVAQISVSPAAADKIYGPDITATDDKDIYNTLATAKKGDYIIVDYCDATGWKIIEYVGTWAQE